MWTPDGSFLYEQTATTQAQFSALCVVKFKACVCVCLCGCWEVRSDVCVHSEFCVSLSFVRVPVLVARVYRCVYV